MNNASGNTKGLLSRPGDQHSYWQRVIGVDLRSLALFRIVIGIIVLIDLAWRSQTLVEMYTDEGFFTRDLANLYYRSVSGSESYSYWSIHKLSGAVEFQWLLFAISAIAAICVTIGWKTRIATVILWVLVASVQTRNPLINTSGDTLLKMLLFWSMFLPTAAVWSIDSFRTRPPRRLWLANFATAGIILQLCYMYWFTGIAKCNEVWYRGEALHYVLQLEIYAKDFATTLASSSWMMKLASWATLVSELFFPALLFLPFFTSRFRWLNIATFWCFHFMIFLSMEIGLFSFISMAGWLPLIPASIWEARWMPEMMRSSKMLGRRKSVGRPVRNFRLARQAVYYRYSASLLGNVVCGGLIVYFLFFNLANINSRMLPRQLVYVGASLNVNQHFQMFGVPPKESPWFVYEAQLVDGSSVDAFRDQALSYEKPESVRQSIPNHHWRKLHRNLARFTPKSLGEFRKSLAGYIAASWNKEHGPDQQIEYLKLTCFLDEIGPTASYGDQVTAVWGTVGKEPSIFDKAFEESMGGDNPFPF